MNQVCHKREESVASVTLNLNNRREVAMDPATLSLWLNLF